jgi:hypothetical protein
MPPGVKTREEIRLRYACGWKQPCGLLHISVTFAPGREYNKINLKTGKLYGMQENEI